MPDAFQRTAFEWLSLTEITPLWVSLLSGFAAVDMFGDIHLTPAGNRYIQSQGTEP
jgi:hypothetical protein